MGHSSRAARKLVLILICIELLLVVMYGTDAWVGNAPEPLHALVDLDAEANLPTWFSSFQLTLIAINFWYFAERRRATQRPSRRFLRCCAGFFLLLSIDETAMLHERVTKLIGERYVDWLPEYFESHVLSTVGCVLVLIAALVMGSSHLRGLSAASCKAMIIAVLGCLLYVAGAAILETSWGSGRLFNKSKSGWKSSSRCSVPRLSCTRFCFYATDTMGVGSAGGTD